MEICRIIAGLSSYFLIYRILTIIIMLPKNTERPQTLHGTESERSAIKWGDYGVSFTIVLPGK